VLDGRAGGVTGVVPALERAQHDRVGQLASRDPWIVGGGHRASLRVVTRLAVRTAALLDHVTIV
jgi:hypothetical protein